jgi:hypothetical protein
MLPLPFFGEPATRVIMSPPTDRISPCLCHQSLASLTYKWRCEKNGEIVSRINFLQRFALTFFIIEVLWYPKPVIWDFSTLRQDIAPTLLPLPYISLSKAMLSKEWWETIAFWQINSSFTHLFSIKLPFLGRMRAINDIAAHRPMFAPSPLPPSFLY